MLFTSVSILLLGEEQKSVGGLEHSSCNHQLYSRMKRRSDEKKSRVLWSASEDDALLKAVLEDKQDREAEGGDAEDEEDWDEIAKSIPGKTPVQCLKRYMVINRRKSGGEPSPPSNTALVPASTTKADPEEESKTSSREERKDNDGPDENDEAEDDDGEKEPKRARKEGDTPTRWPQDDLDLLKKLVENYKDCKLIVLCSDSILKG